MSSDLRSYIAQIKKSKELAVIKKKVSTKFEIASITSKTDNSIGLLFENIRESKFRLASNLVGTRKRFAIAIGADQKDIHKKMIKSIASAKKPKTTSKGKFFENNSSDASVLPVATHFQKESGPFITSSVVYSYNEEKKSQNSSFHRMMPIDKNHFTIRMVEGRHTHRSFIKAKQRGEDLKIAVTVGVHPAVSISGAYQADWGKDEMHIANSILNDKLTMTTLPFSGLSVPSHAEIVMEGKILHNKIHPESMVEMLRTYDIFRKQPVFELEKLYYRNNPIFHDILSGFTEHRLLMGMPIESKITGIMKKQMPLTKQIALTNGGCNWLHAVVQISKKKSSDAKNAIKKTFDAHRSLKQVTIVDTDIDPTNAEAVEYAMATRFQADKDLVIIKNVRGSSLDPSSDQKNLKTAKMGIDATRPLNKRPEGFEIAKIPKNDSISLNKYL